MGLNIGKVASKMRGAASEKIGWLIFNYAAQTPLSLPHRTASKHVAVVREAVPRAMGTSFWRPYDVCGDVYVSAMSTETDESRFGFS